MKKKIIIFSSLFVIIDQIIKILVDKYLVENIEIIANFFSFAKVYNEGAAFSIFSGNRIFLILISIIIFIFLLKYMKSFKNNIRNNIAFILIYGGLFGNLIDRVIYGHVIDYIKFSFGSYTFPVFNIADMGVVIGTFLLFIAILKKEDVNENSSE